MSDFFGARDRHRKSSISAVCTTCLGFLDNRGLGCRTELELDAVAADGEPVAFVFKSFDDADCI